MIIEKRIFIKKQLLIYLELIILSSSFIFLSLGSVDNHEMSLTNEYNVLMVGNTKINARKRIKEVV
jgi:hypothetical protein